MNDDIIGASDPVEVEQAVTMTERERLPEGTTIEAEIESLDKPPEVKEQKK